MGADGVLIGEILMNAPDKNKKYLSPHIQAVGVFVNEEPEIIARFLEEGIIDIAQLHGSEKLPLQMVLLWGPPL